MNWLRTIPSVAVNLARLWHEAGETGPALDLLRPYTENDCRDSRLYTMLGDLHRARQELEHAEAAYRDAIVLDETAIAAWGNLGALLITAGRGDEAVQHLRQGLLRDPDNPGLLMILSEALLATGAPADAIQAAKRALAQQPREPALHMIAGRAQLVAGLAADAVGSFSQAVRLAPDAGDPVMGLVAALRMQQRYDAALKALERAETLVGGEMALREQRLELLFLAGRAGEAWSALSQDLPDALADRCEALADGDTDGAVIDLSGDNGIALIALAWLPDLAPRGAGLTLIAPELLHRLVAESFPDARIIEGPLDADEAAGLQPIIPAGILPPLLHTRLPEMDHGRAYLSAAATDLETWRRRLGDDAASRVLAYRGSGGQPGGAGDAEWQAATDAFRVTGWLSPHIGAPTDDGARPSFADHLETFADLAAAVMMSDLLITDIGEAAHVAGGLARPCILLLPANAEWCWQAEPGPCRLLPSVRIVKPPLGGAWEDVDWAGLAEAITGD